MGRNYEEHRGGLSSSIYEQKRHYEQEIEVLKKDLEAIEIEEQRIKMKLSEQSSIMLDSAAAQGLLMKEDNRSF